MNDRFEDSGLVSCALIGRIYSFKLTKSRGVSFAALVVGGLARRFILVEIFPNPIRVY